MIILMFYGNFHMFSRIDDWVAKILHYFLLYASLVCLCIALPSFVLSAGLDPGYIVKKYDFVHLVEEFIRENRDLMNLCTYCQIVKSETSFHCQFCNKCTELFDHHCPFINNCLGLNNYKYFLVFILFYFLFLVFITAEILRNEIDLFIDNDGPQYTQQYLSLVLYVLIGLNIPVVTYQLIAQVKSLCTRRQY